MNKLIVLTTLLLTVSYVTCKSDSNILSQSSKTSIEQIIISSFGLFLLLVTIMCYLRQGNSEESELPFFQFNSQAIIEDYIVTTEQELTELQQEVALSILQETKKTSKEKKRKKARKETNKSNKNANQEQQGDNSSKNHDKNVKTKSQKDKQVQNRQLEKKSNDKIERFEQKQQRAQNQSNLRLKKDLYKQQVNQEIRHEPQNRKEKNTGTLTAFVQNNLPRTEKGSQRNSPKKPFNRQIDRQAQDKLLKASPRSDKAKKINSQTSSTKQVTSSNQDQQKQVFDSVKYSQAESQ